MKLSILVVSYNELSYLPQCIESCQKTGVEDYEILIGDDGSDDGSIALIEEYVRQDPDHIRYFVQDRSDIRDLIPSLRVSNLLFRAMEMARGEYLHILSGDDYLYPGDFFSKGVAYLDSHPGYCAYVGAYDMVWEKRREHIALNFPVSIYWGGAYIHISAFLFRKSIVDSGALLRRFCDDTGLSYSLAFSGKWKFTAQTVFAYRQREQSITHASDPLQLSIVELMLLQDTLCKGKQKGRCLARFWKPAWYVYRNRQQAAQEKYRKYRDNCSRYPQDILGKLVGFDSLDQKEQRSLKILLLRMRLLHGTYYVLLRAWRLGQKLRNAFAKA